MSDVPETDPLRVLLAELQRTLRDNQQFIRKLKEDDAELDDEEESSDEAATDDEFEEL